MCVEKKKFRRQFMKQVAQVEGLTFAQQDKAEANNNVAVLLPKQATKEEN